MVTWAPASWAAMAEVIPMAPQPTTAMRAGLRAMAMRTASAADPHDRDHPLPPWP